MQKMQAKINQLGVIFCAVILLSSLSISGESLPLIKSTKVDNPKSVLFIGNSFFYYNNGVHKPVLGMVKANKSLGKGHRFRNITINSSSLEWHDVESYVTNEKIGSFSITSSNKYKKYDPENYDLAVMMDCSQCPIHEDRRDLFNYYVDIHSKTLRENGVEPSLLMTWAYKNVPEMIDGLSAAYTSAGNRNEAMVFPVGIAFQIAEKEISQISIWRKTYFFKKSLCSRRNLLAHGFDEKSIENLCKIRWRFCIVT